MHLTRPARLIAVSATAALAATLISAVSASAAPAPPPSPGPKPTGGTSQQQVNQANAAQVAAGARVGEVNGQIAGVQAELQRQQVTQQRAEQAVALRQQQYDDAIDRWNQAQKIEATSKQLVATAKHDVDVAHGKFVQYVQAAYMGGQVTGTGGSMLTADDPTQLLDENALSQYQSHAKADAIGGMQQATVARSNAEAKARKAVQDTAAKKAAAEKAKKSALAAKQDADAAVAKSQTREDELNSELAAKQSELNAAQSAYVQTFTDHQQYVAAVASWNQAKARWATYQQQLRVEAARRAQLKREADERARQEAIDQANARKHHNKRSSGGSSSSSGGSSSGSSSSSHRSVHSFHKSGPAAPSSKGGWTAAKGAQAVRRAKSLLGEPYIWAAGDKYGATDGGCTDPIAPCGVEGYDCSGLVLYAWGRNWAHFAATQYDVGRKHPRPGSFKPGDLLFWSEDGTQDGIGHVAVYIGHGKVVQAPQSGDVVKITPWNQVENGYYGATRPLT